MRRNHRDLDQGRDLRDLPWTDKKARCLDQTIPAPRRPSRTASERSSGQPSASLIIDALCGMSSPNFEISTSKDHALIRPSTLPPLFLHSSSRKAPGLFTTDRPSRRRKRVFVVVVVTDAPFVHDGALYAIPDIPSAATNEQDLTPEIKIARTAQRHPGPRGSRSYSDYIKQRLSPLDNAAEVEVDRSIRTASHERLAEPNPGRPNMV